MTRTRWVAAFILALGASPAACDEGVQRSASDGLVDADGGPPKVDGPAVQEGGLPADGPIAPPPTKACGPTYPTAACGSAPSGSWAFDPGKDTFDPQALLDLRGLNETVAGETGFIKLSADGRDFVKGDGSPIRFWPIGSYTPKDDTELADHARYLAKMGVNMVRWHGHVPSEAANAQITDIKTSAREELWRLVGAMKKEGIYVTLSPYYAAVGVPSYAANMHALLFIDAQLQSAYKSWLDQLFKPTNPHTGIALKDDPAIALIQIQNEDSLLFWTVNALQGSWLDMASQLFAAWLEKKYGSLQAAQTSWKNAAVTGDDFANKLVRFYNIWDMTQPQTSGSGKDLRLSDQLQFWTERMRNFNAEIVRYLRDEIGAKHLVNAGNWKTADPMRLNDAERYSYTAADVMAVNHYYNGGVHEGTQQGWAIVNGDRFTNISALLDPRALPLALKQVANHPMILPESNWVPPLGYQSEGPFLVSAISSLTGIDGFYWFSMGTPQMRQPSSANGYLPSLGKWVINTPELMGNFPAAALMFRKGYIAQGAPVVEEKRALQELWDRTMPIIAESASFDPNRDSQYIPPNSNIPGGVDPLAFLVGPVEVTYDADSSQSKVADLSKSIFENEKVVCSITQQIQWDHKNGVVTLNAKKAQGVTGFLAKRGRFELDDVTIESCNAYATVLLVSMDDAPLATSRQILVQTGTIARPTDWQQKAASWQDAAGKTVNGFEIVNYGKAPWRIVDSDLTVTLTNPQIKEAVVLDLHGVSKQVLPLTRQGASVRFQLPADAKYLILR